MPEESQAVTLSLISHTNAGKTSLARTLLKRDVGEVRDAAHVTIFNEAYTLIETDKASLVLWDTPGLGDSGRMLRRLKRMEKPVMWFLSQMWDRFTDKPLWCAQQALRNVRDDAEVVLYLVNASESLAGGALVEHEMEILGWLQKPVIVLLNQTGTPRPPEEEAAEQRIWREHLGKAPIVKAIVSLDGFTRCWVQEDELMDVISKVLPTEKNLIFKGIAKAWRSRNEAIFEDAMRILANQLTANALDSVPVKPETMVQRLGFNRGDLEAEWSAARQRLSESLATRAAQAMNELIHLHGLEGSEDSEEMMKAAREDFATPGKVDAAVWSAISGIASGALAGLVVDLKAGGLTFGGASILGGLSGGLGAYALIKTYSLTKGDDNRLHWSREHLREQVKLALLAYLAVAHFGRGRGAWKRDTRPEFWSQHVGTVVDATKDKLDSVWKKASRIDPSLGAVHGDLQCFLSEAAREVLEQLYPKHAEAA